jgi:hypothetical protein
MWWQAYKKNAADMMACRQFFIETKAENVVRCQDFYSCTHILGSGFSFDKTGSFLSHLVTTEVFLWSIWKL